MQNLFVFSSEINFQKYSKFIKEVSDYGHSANVLLLFETGNRIEDINPEEYSLVFTDSQKGFGDRANVRLLDKLSIQDVIHDINISCLKC